MWQYNTQLGSGALSLFHSQPHAAAVLVACQTFDMVCCDFEHLLRVEHVCPISLPGSLALLLGVS